MITHVRLDTSTILAMIRFVVLAEKALCGVLVGQCTLQPVCPDDHPDHQIPHTNLG